MAVNDATATFNVPETKPAIDRVLVDRVVIDRESATAIVRVVYLDATEEIRASFEWVIHEAVEIGNFLTAIGAARPTETGGVRRRFNFRVLGFLVDTGRLSNVTLAA